MGNDHPITIEKKIEYNVFPIDPALRDAAYKIEEELFSKYSFQAKNDMYYKDISFDYWGNNYLHTLMCGVDRKDKETIVMLHGYQGNSLSFYRILPLIYEKFNAYAPDLFGMGLSSRPDITFVSPEQCNEIFIESLEAWRKALGLEKFYLCGHSLGGYFALIYALKYPEHVKDIILFAPSGITDLKRGGNIHETTPFIVKIGFKIIPYVWKTQPRLQDLNHSVATRKLLNMGLRKRYDISEEESELTAKITEYTLKYPKDLDQCLYYIFKYPLPTPQIPLEEQLDNKLLDKRILFLYGQTDWMERIGPLRLKEKFPDRIEFYTISKYGHTFPLENPEEVANVMNNYLVKEVKNNNHKNGFH